MGIIISRFRKKKPTLDVLDDLDKRIRDLEAQGANAAKRYQQVSKGLVLYTVGLYVISVAIWYWYWPPLNTRQQLYRLPILVFIPILIFIMRLVVKYYYTHKMRRNDEKLVDMRRRKKEILEEVMDHETYKVARTILEKFAPESLGVKGSYASLMTSPAQLSRKQEAILSATANQDIRRRVVPSLTNTAGQALQRPIARASANSPEFRGDTPNMSVTKPLLPYERTFLDRILEYIIGDGPSNRFALICKSCMCHNGMALKEEFEYLQFRCYHCQHWNPARKQRPQAPRLEGSPTHSSSDHATGTLLPSNTKSGLESSSDSEDEGVQELPTTEDSINEKDTNNETGEIKSEETSVDHDSRNSTDTGVVPETSQEREKIEETPMEGTESSDN